MIKERINESIKGIRSHEIQNDNTTTTSTRMVIWNQAVSLMMKKPLGYGIGTVTESLVSEYKKIDFTKGVKRRLNAHNQFLQTTLTIGYPGLLLFLCLLTVPVYYLKKQTKVLFLLFVSIIAIVSLTESILETLSGIIFFSVFYSIIILRQDNVPFQQTVD